MTRHLLFLPGAGADPEFWRPLGTLLPAQWRKTYLGWPGIGNQPPHPRVNGIEDLVAMVEAQLGDSPVDLLAQSMGGAVALRVALNHPNRVRRLVLAVTSGGVDVTASGAADWRPEYQAAFPDAAPWITKTRPDFTPELSHITHPTLLIWGDADPISPLAVGETLLKLLPNASLHVVRGGNHGLINDRANEVANLVQRHLE